jgi:hypothetical protein
MPASEVLKTQGRDLSEFDEGSAIRQSDRVLTQLHKPRIDVPFIVVKTVSLPISIDHSQIQRQIEHS